MLLGALAERLIFLRCVDPSETGPVLLPIAVVANRRPQALYVVDTVRTLSMRQEMPSR